MLKSETNLWKANCLTKKNNLALSEKLVKNHNFVTWFSILEWIIEEQNIDFCFDFLWKKQMDGNVHGLIVFFFNNSF